MSAVNAQETNKEQTTKGEAVKFELSSQLLKQIRQSPDKVLEKYLKTLYRIKKSGVVTRADLELYKKVLTAKTRSGIVAQFLHLDLDGDTIITPKEFETVQNVEEVNARSRNKIFELNADTNGDGNISIKELSDYAKINIKQKSHRGFSRQFTDIFIFDLNKDEKVDAKELSDAIKKIAADPTLEASNPPVANGAALRRNNYRNHGALECKLPQVPAGADVVVVSGYEGAAASTVTIAGQDRLTTAGHLNIEAGKKPLYIFTNVFKPHIWRITGAIERVAKFVMATDNNAKQGGVVGLGAEKVDFAAIGNCINYFTKPNAGKARIASAKISYLLKQPTKKTISSYKLPKIHVPSGHIEEDVERKVVTGAGLHRDAVVLNFKKRAFEKLSKKNGQKRPP